MSAGNLTNATAIGYEAIVNASNKVRLGNTAVTVIEGQVAFTASSDKTKKENFQPVDGEAVLGKIRGFELSSWNFIGHDPKEFRHYGPMAQDFFAAFGQDGVGQIGTETTRSTLATWRGFSWSRIFPSTASPSTGWKFSFLVLSELAVNATCPSITVTAVLPRRTLLLALTNGLRTDSRSVG